jgi:predicted phage terminase large subunit-like protein
MKLSTVFERNSEAFNNKFRYIVNQGGARSSKTYSILQLLLLLTYNTSQKLIISIVSQSIPHLKLGAIRDFKAICYNSGLIFDNYFNKSELKFEYRGSIIEFFSTDNLGKVHGPARDYLFINECNNISFEVFEQLEIRTRRTIFLDFNPISYFWVHSEILTKENSILIKSTYLDNYENLSPEIIKSIESKKDKKNWWTVYGLGEIGFSESLLFAQSRLKYYSLPDIQPTENDLFISYTDIANGGDFFCTVFGILKDKTLYVQDVIYNKELITFNQNLLPIFIKKYNIQLNIIESNAQGYLFAHNVKSQVEAKHQIKLKNNSTNKEDRIKMNAILVNDYFCFRKDTSENADYINFMRDLTGYIYNEKNLHDDAPDACTALAKELYYMKLL